MKTWKKGAIVGGVWGILCFLVGWTLKLEPWSKVPASTFQKIIFLPLYIAYNLPTSEWFYTLLLIPTTIIIGALIGATIGYIIDKRKGKNNVGGG